MIYVPLQFGYSLAEIPVPDAGGRSLAAQRVGCPSYTAYVLRAQFS